MGTGHIGLFRAQRDRQCDAAVSRPSQSRRVLACLNNAQGGCVRDRRHRTLVGEPFWPPTAGREPRPTQCCGGGACGGRVRGFELGALDGARGAAVPASSRTSGRRMRPHCACTIERQLRPHLVKVALCGTIVSISSYIFRNINQIYNYIHQTPPLAQPPRSFFEDRQRQRRGLGHRVGWPPA